jgi:cytoskeletal protein CcmA (bactofilin family)
MFNKKTPMSKSTNEINSPDKLNRIVEGTTIEGEIRAESNIRVDGKVKGLIQSSGRLVVGPKGFIQGRIECQNADVEGVIEGEIKVSELLTLKSTAKLHGDISTAKLAIEPGADFSGTCSMGASVKEIAGNKQEKDYRQKEKTA